MGKLYPDSCEHEPQPLDEFLDPIGRCLHCGELFYNEGYPPNFCSDYCADKEVKNLS